MLTQPKLPLECVQQYMASANKNAENVTNHDSWAFDEGPRLLTSEPKHLELPAPAICVICLERIPDKAIALPCQHDQFHFSCLGTWLQQARACPLCKREVKGIRYRDDRSGTPNVFYLAHGHSARLPRRQFRTFHHGRYREPAPSHRQGTIQAVQHDPALAFRKSVYENRRCSMYIGSNAHSKYRNIDPGLLCQEGHLITKAKKWIRRELGVFDFLNPSSPDFGRSDRRATNAEYLLEYIVAILKSIDLKGSAGQAEELLKEFLGKENARLFLHELEAWLRSPFESLKDWDQATQYAEPK